VSNLSLEEFEGTDRFAPRRRLGAGSFGVVYEVLDLHNNTTLALKLLRQSDPDSLYRFKKEFRSLAGIVHPNLVTFYELILNEDVGFITMELVRGRSFLEYVRQKSVLPYVGRDAETVSDLDRLEEISTLPHHAQPFILPDYDRLRASLRQLAEGLNALHGAGKLHRDIKPPNVLVTDEGRVVILDFGFVTDLDPTDSRHSVASAGTPAYMAPEQAIGRQVTAASDWYAVGVMLYEALTGGRPFSGRVEDILREKQITEPPPPMSLAPDTPTDLNSLCCDLLHLDPRVRPSGSEVLLRLGDLGAKVKAGTPVSQPKSTQFVGRESQLEALGEAFEASKAGRSVAVRLEGRSGIGKSVLVRRFLDEIQVRNSNVVVLTGQCYQQESVPYKALDSLVDVLSRYLASLSRVDAEALMPRDVLALARLFPVLKRVSSISDVPRRVAATPDAKELQRRSFLAMREILARLSDRVALILFIDDVQWGDVDSAALLAEILRPPDPPPLLLILAFREDESETSPMLRALFPALTSSVEIREVKVEELTHSEAQDLATSLLGLDQPDLIEHIVRESGGSPFFISELARPRRTDVGIGRLSLDEMIYQRIELLPPEARRALEVIAVAGKPCAEHVPRDAGHIDATAYPKMLAILHSAHMIRTRETELRSELEIYHDRIRETVVSRLDEQVLKEHHRDLAEAFEALGGADPETMAVHYQACGSNERAAEYASQAAERAFDAFAFDRSARLFALALELQPQDESERHSLNAKLGDALSSAGRGAEAARAYLVAASSAEDAANRSELERRAAEQLLRAGHIDEGRAILQQVLRTTGMKIAKTPLGALLSLLSRRAYLALRGLKFKERPSHEIPARDLLRIDTCWAIGIGLGHVDVIRASDALARHLHLALKAGDPQRVARGLTGEAVAIASNGVRSEPRALKLIAEASTIADRLQLPELTARIILASGYAAFFSFRWQDAIELTQEAEQILRSQCVGVSWELNTAHHFILRSLLYQGKWSHLTQQFSVLVHEACERGDRLTEIGLRLRVGFILHLAADRPELAPQEIDLALGNWVKSGFHMQHYWGLRAMAEIDLYCGNGLSAWNRVTKKWNELQRTLTLRLQLSRIESVHLYGRAALCASLDDVDLQRNKVSGSRLLRLAEKSAAKLLAEGVPWATGLGMLLKAGIAGVRLESDNANELLLLAERQFELADSMMLARVAKRCRGELIGGSAGAELISDCDEWMKTETVKNPVRLAAMLAPGRWRG
jgi:eukaryotic-like serine/threonine-protein kinase